MVDVVEEFDDNNASILSRMKRKQTEGFKRPGFMQIVKMANNANEIDRSQLIMTPHQQ